MTQVNKTESVNTSAGANATSSSKAQVNSSGATNKTANATPASPPSLDDTISQVFDEIHDSSQSLSTSNSSEEADGTEQGFIGKHLKKLQEKEEQRKRKLEEDRRAAEIEKYGGLIDKQEAAQLAQQGQKPRGIIARARAKIDKELKDQ